MSLTPFHVIPGLVCLFWLFVHMRLASQQETYRVLALLLLLVFFSAAGDVIMGSITGSDVVAHLTVVLCAPALIPLVVIYLSQLIHPDEFKPVMFAWIMIPAALFSASLLCVSTMGIEQSESLLDRIHSGLLTPSTLSGIERSYYLWTVTIFRWVIGLEAAFMLIYSTVLIRRYRFWLSNVWAFHFKGRKIRVLELQLTLSVWIILGLIVKVFLHEPFYRHFPMWTVVIVAFIAVLMFQFGFYALFGSKEFITKEDIRTALRFNYSRQSQTHMTEEVMVDMADNLSDESLSQVISRMMAPPKEGGATQQGFFSGNTPTLMAALFGTSKSWDEGSLVYRFQRLMQDEQLFLQPSLTLTEVADRLHSNKTYISKMVNQTYGIGFPEVLNVLRVDYAQQYMRAHKSASQKEVAKEAGFLSASSFNTVFKRITGTTPKLWMAKKV